MPCLFPGWFLDNMIFGWAGPHGRRCSRNEIQNIQWKSFVCSLFELTKFVVLRWRCQHHKMRILAGKHSCERMTLGHLTSWTTGFLQETMPCLHGKHLLPSLSFNWDVRTFWTGWRFKTRLGLLWTLDSFCRLHLSLIIFVSGSDSARSADKEKGSRRRRSAQGVALRFPDLSRSKGPTGSNANLTSVERSCEVRPDYQTGLMRNLVLLSPVGNFLGVRSGGHEVSKRDFS